MLGSVIGSLGLGCVGGWGVWGLGLGSGIGRSSMGVLGLGYVGMVVGY